MGVVFGFQLSKGTHGHTHPRTYGQGVRWPRRLSVQLALLFVHSIGFVVNPDTEHAFVCVVLVTKSCTPDSCFFNPQTDPSAPPMDVKRGDPRDPRDAGIIAPRHLGESAC